jgi:RNA polymerase sigma-70 factor, ECF subfamily
VTVSVGEQSDAAGSAPGDDPDANFVRAVYAEHGPALLAYATRLIGDRGQAEDVVQETLLRAWQHAEGLAADSRPLRPWLFTVAARVAVDAHRARRARPIETTPDALATLAAPDELDRALQAWQVAEALATLSPPHRAALVETYYRGRSVAEAALVLGVRPGTVKSRVYYALRALRLAFEESGWTT